MLLLQSYSPQSGSSDACKSTVTAAGAPGLLWRSACLLPYQSCAYMSALRLTMLKDDTHRLNPQHQQNPKPTWSAKKAA